MKSYVLCICDLCRAPVTREEFALQHYGSRDLWWLSNVPAELRVPAPRQRKDVKRTARRSIARVYWRPLHAVHALIGAFYAALGGVLTTDALVMVGCVTFVWLLSLWAALWLHSSRMTALMAHGKLRLGKVRGKHGSGLRTWNVLLPSGAFAVFEVPHDVTDVWEVPVLQDGNSAGAIVDGCVVPSDAFEYMNEEPQDA